MAKDKYNILVIDDDQQIIDLITMFITRNYEDQINCVSAIDAQMAVLKLSNQEFDLIITDYRMPGRTGLDLSNHVKKSIKFSRIPIILMSGALLQKDAVDAIEMGIKDILVKPFTMKQLMAKISNHLELS
jgi:DNA-binding response OmpR family regulator